MGCWYFEFALQDSYTTVSFSSTVYSYFYVNITIINAHVFRHAHADGTLTFAHDLDDKPLPNNLVSSLDIFLGL